MATLWLPCNWMLPAADCCWFSFCGANKCCLDTFPAVQMNAACYISAIAKISPSISLRVFLILRTALSNASTSFMVSEILANNCLLLSVLVLLSVFCCLDTSSAFLVASWFWASFQASFLAHPCCSCSAHCLSQIFLRALLLLGRGSWSASWKRSTSSSLSLSLKCSSSSLNWSSKEAMQSSFACRALCFLGTLASMTWRGHSSSCTKITWLWRMPRLLIFSFSDRKGREVD